jgi:hypothetical protein
MPVYLLYLLQPLDVSCFSPLKHAYSYLIKDKMQLGFNYINKFNFLKAYPQACTVIFLVDNIKSSFSATGLILLNLD